MTDTLDHILGNDILSGEPDLAIMADGSNSETLVIDPSALSGLGMIDVIPDFGAQGTDTLDLSDVLAGLDVGAPIPDVATVDGTAGGTFVEVATLTDIGIGSVISILFDDAKPLHSETVT